MVFMQQDSLGTKNGGEGHTEGRVKGKVRRRTGACLRRTVGSQVGALWGPPETAKAGNQGFKERSQRPPPPPPPTPAAFPLGGPLPHVPKGMELSSSFPSSLIWTPFLHGPPLSQPHPGHPGHLCPPQAARSPRVGTSALPPASPRQWRHW